MNLTFLPERILKEINNINIDKVYEIRLRKNAAITIFYDKAYYFLTSEGLKKTQNKAIICLENDINQIINKVTDYSFYASSESIKEGYLTTEDGIRIGLVGTCVFEREKIITIKDFTSLVIRIPHNVIGCSDEIFKHINNKCLNNTLIISPPRFGKTTILKDLIRNLDALENNILVIDERGELSSKIDNSNADIIKYSNKLYAFEYGIRSVSPNIVITDELATKSDWECARKASLSGVKIIASCHGKSIEDIINKEFFLPNLFEAYVILDSKETAGKILAIYDKNLEKIND